MNWNAAEHSKPEIVSGVANSNLLQRRCPCGECESGCWKRLTMQRRVTSEAEPTTIPPIVHEVLRWLGQPLDPATRAFEQDLNRVQVHIERTRNR